jgi:hypothetical protein
MRGTSGFLTHFAVYLKKIGNFFPSAYSPNFYFLVENLPTFGYHKFSILKKALPSACINYL